VEVEVVLVDDAMLEVEVDVLVADDNRELSSVVDASIVDTVVSSVVLLASSVVVASFLVVEANEVSLVALLVAPDAVPVSAELLS
jgi:hypothetical protein